MRSTGVRAGAMDVIPETVLPNEEIRELDAFLIPDATPDECMHIVSLRWLSNRLGDRARVGAAQRLAAARLGWREGTRLRLFGTSRAHYRHIDASV